MKASALFKQYVWLVDTIRRAGYITLREINDRWVRSSLSERIPFSRTSFRRHRDEVEEMFGISIRCDNRNRYYIEDNVLKQKDSVLNWMLGTLVVSNLVSEARDMHDRILLESIPEEDHLLQLVDAMRRNHRINITYRRYGTLETKQWILEPYCIKLFRRRWYLLGRFIEGKYILLSFDRILSAEPVEETFEIDSNFDAQSYFSEYYGVMTNDRIPITKIVFRAYGNERFALKDLPLHPSQNIVKEGDDFVDFEVRLRPTSDFFAQIMSRGRWVKIISPDDIVLEIRKLIQDSLEEYK